MAKFAVTTLCSVMCVCLVNGQQPIKLPQAYSTGVEAIVPMYKNIHYRKSLVDRDRQIYSLDLSLPRTIDGFGNVIEKSEIDVLDISFQTLHIENKTTTECKVFFMDSKLFNDYYKLWEAILRDIYDLENGKHKFIDTFKIRGRSVDADLFRRVYSEFSPLTNTNVTTQSDWYLLNTAWTEVGSGDSTQGHRRPMMFQMNINDKINPVFNFTTNFYDWSFRRPYLSRFSISNCYGSNFRKRVKIDFSVAGGSFSRALTIAEVDQIADSVAKAIGISVLRISKNEVKRNGNTLTFYTSLLADAYEIKQPESEVPKGKFLADAYRELVDKAKRGMISVQSVAGVNLKSTNAAEEIVKGNGPSYSPGAMAGIAFGMLFLGIILAIVIGGFVFYKKTGKIPLKEAFSKDGV